MLFNKKQNNFGFTLVEILIAMAIFVLISAMVLVNFRKGEHNTEFLSAAQLIGSDIRKMQTQTLTGILGQDVVSSGGFGLYFTLNQNDRYLTFRDLDGNTQYDAGTDTVVNTIILPTGITISALSTDPNPLTIVFQPPKPTIYLNGAQALPSAQITLTSAKVSGSHGAVTISRITGQVNSSLQSN